MMAGPEMREAIEILSFMLGCLVVGFALGFFGTMALFRIRDGGPGDA